MARYPELRILDRLWYVPPVLLGLGLFAVGGWHWVVWGYFVSTFLLSNGTYTINSLMHYWGRQRFYTGDESRNHWLLALLTLGEGWHNNHHRYQAATRNGFFWYEIDPTYYLLKLMSFVGLVRDLNPVPDKIMEEARLNRHLWRVAKNEGVIFSPSQLGVRDLLVQMPFSAKGFVAENMQRVRGDMRGLAQMLAKRGDELGADVRALSSHISERGQQLRHEIQALAQQEQRGELLLDMQGWGAQVAERGRHLHVEVEALAEQVAERGRHLRGDVEALGGQVAERGQALRREVETLSEEVGATAGQLAADMADLHDQVAETIGHLREDTEMLGRQLREEAEELRAEVGMAARQLLAEVEVLTEQMTERAQRLRGEVEAWSGVLPHMA